MLWGFVSHWSHNSCSPLHVSHLSHFKPKMLFHTESFEYHQVTSKKEIGNLECVIALRSHLNPFEADILLHVTFASTLASAFLKAWATLLQIFPRSHQDQNHTWNQGYFKGCWNGRNFSMSSQTLAGPQNMTSLPESLFVLLCRFVRKCTRKHGMFRHFLGGENRICRFCIRSQLFKYSKKCQNHQIKRLK